ncbi:MAG: DUF368 domain-containing protein [Oscillospiraceae bacterium]|jgi:putative membrane protein|nr:DUF368 domain-containing protein [Oscillospiraceae bacterium]
MSSNLKSPESKDLAGAEILENGQALIPQEEKDSVRKWIIRFFQGAVIALGFVIPGISGGMLTIVFGMYDKMMGFLAHPKKNFIKNVLFFTPVGVGWGFGTVLSALTLKKLFDDADLKPILILFFVGAIIGTFPMLFREAGEKGRKTRHWVALGLSVAVSFGILFFVKLAEDHAEVSLIEANFGWRIFEGVMTSLGAILPGMSPSSFLIFLGLYSDMNNILALQNLLGLIPFALGVILTLVVCSKGVHWLFQKYHGIMYHITLGVVISSAVVIIPFKPAEYPHGNSLPLGLLALVVGLALSLLLAKMESKVKS